MVTVLLHNQSNVSVSAACPWCSYALFCKAGVSAALLMWAVLFSVFDPWAAVQEIVVSHHPKEHFCTPIEQYRDRFGSPVLSLTGSLLSGLFVYSVHLTGEIQDWRWYVQTSSFLQILRILHLRIVDHCPTPLHPGFHVSQRWIWELSHHVCLFSVLVWQSPET